MLVMRELNRTLLLIGMLLILMAMAGMWLYLLYSGDSTEGAKGLGLAVTAFVASGVSYFFKTHNSKETE